MHRIYVKKNTVIVVIVFTTIKFLDSTVFGLPGSSIANLAHSGISEDSLDESEIVSAAAALGLAKAASAGGMLGRTKSMGRD